MLPALQRHFREVERPRINRAPSPTFALILPWFVVVLGSLSPSWPVISSAPVLPPFGLMILIAWHQLRPGLLPIWAGLPLGLVDDLYSGQPVGSAVMLWSIAMIVLEVVELRLPWRSVALNWLIAAGLLVGYLLLALAIANLAGGHAPVRVLWPQIIITVLTYPLATRLVWVADRLRLIPVRTIE